MKINARDFDELMELVGADGKYQKRFNFWYNMVYVVLVAMPYMNLVLVMNVPPHWCHVPGRESTNYSLESWKAMHIPRAQENTDHGEYKSCRMYNLSGSAHGVNTSAKQEIGCQHGWEFDKTWFAATVPSDNEWVCDKELNVANTFVLSRLGDVVGTFIFGQLGDMFGRRLVFFVSTGVLAAGRCLLAAVSDGHAAFAAVVFLGSCTASAVFGPPTIVGMEISSGKRRAQIAMTQCMGLTLGAVLASLIAWATRHWVVYLLLTSVPCLCFFVPYRQFVESPRWLATKGRHRQCAAVLCRVARTNGRLLDSAEVEDAVARLQSGGETMCGVAGLLSSWRLARNTAIIVVCWSASSLTNFTLMLNVSNMSGNPFLNYIWQSLAELPGFALGRPLSDKVGRRWTHAVSFALAAAAFLATAAVAGEPDLHWLLLATLAVSKVCVTVSYYVVYLQAMETYPTCVRQTGTSLGSLSASGAGVLGPYIVYLGSAVDVKYPYLVLFAVAAVAAVCATFLPETLNQELPQDLGHARFFGHDHKYWSLTPVASCARFPAAPADDEDQQHADEGPRGTVRFSSSSSSCAYS